MQHHLKKMWPTAAASMLALTNIALADADSAQMRNLENRVTALEQRKSSSGVINPPGRPQVVHGANLFITADALYWVAHEDGFPLFVKNEDQSFNDNLSDAEAVGLDWDWNWGFRVGFGYNMPHDGWDLILTWMRVYGDADQHEHVDSEDALWPSWTHPGARLNNAALGAGPYTKAKADWHLQLDQIDLEMGREFFVSKWLTLRPHFGLRTDWIHQKIEIHYNRFLGNSGQDYEIDAKNHFWGLGIAAGLDTQWGLGGGWSIFGNAAFAVLYGFHDLDREDELSNSTEADFVDLDYSYRISRAVADMQLGIRWDKMFDHDRFHFGIQAGWEHHIYFAQNQFIRFADDVALGDLIGNQGDLSFQGWTLSARFDF